MSDDMSEFEAEVGDVVDPSPWQYHTNDELPHRGVEIWEHLKPAIDLMLDDILKVVNERRSDACLVSYLAESGLNFMAGLVDFHTIQIVVKLPGDTAWVSFDKPEGDGE